MKKTTVYADFLICCVLLLISCQKRDDAFLLSELKTANDCYIRGEMEKSLSVLTGIEKRNPDFIPALFLSGKIYFFQSDFRKAEDKWRRILKEQPYHTSTGKWLLRLYISEERYKEADQTLIKLLEVSPEDPDILFLAGRLKKDEGKYLDAIEYFEKGFLFEDRLIEAHLDLSEIYSMFGIREKSIRNLEKAVSIGGKEHELYKPVKSLIESME